MFCRSTFGYVDGLSSYESNTIESFILYVSLVRLLYFIKSRAIFAGILPSVSVGVTPSLTK